MKLIEHLSRRSIKYVLLTYLAISVMYTGARFYKMTAESSTNTRTARRSLIEPINLSPNNTAFFVAPLTEVDMEKDEEDELKNIVHLNDDLQATSNSAGDVIALEKIVITENRATIKQSSDPVFQSKIYSGAMGPSDLLPYFSLATEKFDDQDITIYTIVTSDRFPVLSRLATRYKGPISAAVHINDDDSKEKELDLLYQTLEENPDIKRYVDIHLIVDKYDRQFNMWRNTAKLYARTEYIMMLDIDFYLCTDFRKEILRNPSLMNMLRQGRTALVVPAFEYLDQSGGKDPLGFPTTKQDLLHQVFEQEKLDMFHVAWQKGHSATNYAKWYTTDKPYKVQDYNFSYEPYVIFKKQGSPWCDERFIGYGANKAACLYEIYLSGIDYYVLPNDFLIHQSHAYPESTRKRERLFNRKVYTNFREELCLRYSRQFLADGQWDTPRSENLRNECSKIRGFNSVLVSIDE